MTPWADEQDEPADLGDEAGVDADLVELHQVLEWQAAVAVEQPPPEDVR